MEIFRQNNAMMAERAAFIPDATRFIMERLEREGYEAAVVGGCVRDLLIRRPPHDYDITTDATPDIIESIFRDHRMVSIGKEHGTVGVIVDHVAYEVTTYRVDGEYTDHRRPDTVEYTRSRAEDLERRDFTINAMAMDLRGVIYGVEHAMEDLAAHRIRAVGDPEQRLREDALRMMRALRFASQLGYAIEPRTAEVLRSHCTELHRIAPERIREELDKLLIAPNAVPVLREYREVIGEVIPELRAGFDHDQNNPFHCYDVYEHILYAVAACPPDRVIRLAALLHDIGKPACYVVKDGWGHFYQHESVSAEMANQILRRLRYDHETVKLVTELVQAHGAVFQLTERYARRKLHQLGEAQLRRLIVLERADVSAQAEHVRADRLRRMDEFEALVGRVLEEEQCFARRDLVICGTDVIELGMPEGPGVGLVLNRVFDEVLDGILANERTALRQRAKEIIEEGIRS